MEPKMDPKCNQKGSKRDSETGPSTNGSPGGPRGRPGAENNFKIEQKKDPWGVPGVAPEPKKQQNTQKMNENGGRIQK